MNEFENKSIECSVTNCANHCEKTNYCALKKIMVGGHGKQDDCEHTDCRSFKERCC